MICHLLLNFTWIWMPLVLASSLTKRCIQISTNPTTAKLLRGRWLFLHGMEYENSEEGVKLLRESKAGRKRHSQSVKSSNGTNKN